MSTLSRIFKIHIQNSETSPLILNKLIEEFHRIKVIRKFGFRFAVKMKQLLKPREIYCIFNLTIQIKKQKKKKKKMDLRGFKKKRKATSTTVK